MKCTKKLFAGLVSVFALAGGAQAAQISVEEDIATSEMWVSTNEYVLASDIDILDGATLTIQPGTVIRGMSFEDAGNKATCLWVGRGGKLIARGTKERPIIFTDMEDNNFPWVNPADVLEDYKTINPTSSMRKKAALWGGLAMLGKAYCTYNASANVGPLVETTGLAEGRPDPGDGTTQYGGDDDDDSSGVLSYVSIRYAGYGFAAASEINGLTLYGVGRGTQIDHVEIVGNLDDGIEFFGGTVNTKYVAMYNIGDDAFDVDQGYRGRGQFLFVMEGFCNADGVAGSGINNHGFEMDGAEKSDDNRPWGLQRYENVTLIGNRYRGTGGTGTSGSETSSEGISMDDNCRAQFFNCIMMDVDSMLCAVESDNAKPDSFEGMSAVWNAFPTHTPGTGALDNTPYYYQSQSTNAAQTAFRNFVVYNCAVTNLICKTTSANVKRAGGDVALLPEWDWNQTATMPIRYMARETDTVAYPQPTVGNGLLHNVKTIDPRPISAWGTSPYSADDDGFATPASYYGAFAPTGDTWLDGWSVLATSGMLVKQGSGELTVDQAAFSVGFAAEIGSTYTLYTSTDSGATWLPVSGATAVADKANMTLADFSVTAEASKLYKVVAD